MLKSQCGDRRHPWRADAYMLLGCRITLRFDALLPPNNSGLLKRAGDRVVLQEGHLSGVLCEQRVSSDLPKTKTFLGLYHAYPRYLTGHRTETQRRKMPNLICCVHRSAARQAWFKITSQLIRDGLAFQTSVTPGCCLFVPGLFLSHSEATFYNMKESL